MAASVSQHLERSARARTLIARNAARRSVRSGALWGYVFAVTVASSALSYGRIYRTAGERERLAQTFGSNHAAAALFGPAPQLQTVAGFTVFKASMTLAIVGAMWGLLVSTRLLRGDEDAGRWELLVSGETTRRGAVAQVLVGLGAAVAVLWAITALVIGVVGLAPSVGIGWTAALYFAASLVATAAVFISLGAVTSQLFPSRVQAARYAAVFLGLSYGVRMVGDAVTGVHWLVWLSPLGWVEELRPLTRPQPWVFGPIVGFVVVTGSLAVVLAGRRDVGSGTVPDRSARAPRTRLLGGPTGLTVRLTESSGLWWAMAVGLSGLIMGVVAKAAGTTIVGSSVQQVFARLGARGSGPNAFLGVAFGILAIVLAGEAATLVAAARTEEAEGRLDHLLAAVVGRGRWLGGRLAAGGMSLLVCGVAGGVGVGLGAATQASGPSLPTVLSSGLNTVPPALFVLGVGALALGAWPRAAAPTVYAVIGWSALVELVGGFFGESRWVADTSLFHQMAAAPAVSPDWETNGVLVGLGVVAMMLGAAAFRRRDLQTG